MANFLTKNKKVIIFVISFLVVALSDVVIFSGLFSQIFVNQFSWVLDNAILSLLIYFWMFIGMPSLIAYFVAFVVFKGKSKIVNEGVVVNNEVGEAVEKKQENKQIKTAIIATVILGILITVFIRWGTQPRFLPYTFQSIQPGELFEPYPNVGWKTYTNDQYGFELKAPEINTQVKTGNLIAFGKFEKPYYCPYVMSVIELPSTINLKNWFIKMHYDNFGRTSFEETKIDNKQAIRYGDPYNYIILINPKTVIDISVIDSDIDTKNQNQLIEQILSTFKFTTGGTNLPSPTTSKPAPPVGWKTNQFNSQNLIIYTPVDWQSSIQDFPSEPSSLIKFWKKDSPTIVPIQLNIKANWKNIGIDLNQQKSYLVGGIIPAFRVDPPKKEDITLERY